MKIQSFYSILLALLCLMAVSCGDEIESLQWWVEDYHYEKWRIDKEAVVYCQLTPSDTPNYYKGSITLLEDDEMVEIPITVNKEGKDVTVMYYPDKNLNELVKPFTKRGSHVSKANEQSVRDKRTRSSSDNHMINGTTTIFYNDALNYNYKLTLKIDGSAFFQLLTQPKDELQEYAYARERKGINGSWEESSFYIGNATRKYIDVHLPDGSLYVSSDGYVYRYYDDMKLMNNGFRYSAQ